MSPSRPDAPDDSLSDENAAQLTPPLKVDLPRIERAVREILLAIGEGLRVFSLSDK